ncbi:MAG: Alternative dihydrofolate reductase 2 / Dihydropteroate synthase (EC [uncultured Campylobacterales bacterium]|uniref:dihydropteroate synthase n=1 Tax=uncultured Campylobacterales bacterium TaxID=352960 RepID=A0A6S6SVY0_9BACT|nr:MAG: Alternative dihydrofolate reductase 2 / Dihydropteroate synthase (EC [uncultured Campylobacterales bacterium]
MIMYEIDSGVEKILQSVGTTKEGISIIKQKAYIHKIYIKDIKTGAANILKQDALSVGADVGVSEACVFCGEEYTDAILLATPAQLKKLVKKEKLQPFGLRNLSIYMNELLKAKTYENKIMGVINANDDSFFDSSRLKGDDAVKKINTMIQEGANIIDIGAVSSAPNSKLVNEDEELLRIKPIIDEIYKQKLYEKAELSVDSYSPKVVKYTLDRGFKIVNDITGLKNDEIARLASEYKAKVVIMHMQNNPSNMQDNPEYKDAVNDVSEFFKSRLAKANEFGIKDVILDVGIGFGKTLEHNISLIKSLAHFRSFGCELLIGGSRKSMIDKIVSCKPEDRLPGTLSLHIKALENGANILRVHDVKEHYQALKVYESLK